MTKVTIFASIDEYVSFLTSLPMAAGEAFCFSYIPSCFFPKDSVWRFFDRYERAKDSKGVADNLWQYGRRQISAFTTGQAKMSLEERCLARLCSLGQIHDATPEYEVGFSERTYALRKIKALVTLGSIVVFDGPAPYTFRLHPPNGVLIDVARNVAQQQVQGIWIEDDQAFKSFSRELSRVFDRNASTGQKVSVDKQLTEAITALTGGEKFDWRAIVPTRTN